MLENIDLAFVRRAARHCYRAMGAYRLGLEGPLLDYALKVYSSHRRIPMEKYNEIVSGYNAEKENKKILV